MEDENLEIQEEPFDDTEENSVNSKQKHGFLLKLLLYTSVFNVFIGLLNLIDSSVTFKNIAGAWNYEFFQRHKIIDTVGTTITFLTGIFMIILGINIYNFTSTYKKDLAENPDDETIGDVFASGLRKYFFVQLFVLLLLLLKVLAVLYIRLFTFQ